MLPIYTPTEKIKSYYPVVDLLTATKLNKILQSNIQVVAVSEVSYIAPAYAIAKNLKPLVIRTLYLMVILGVDLTTTPWRTY